LASAKETTDTAASVSHAKQADSSSSSITIHSRNHQRHELVASALDHAAGVAILEDDDL